MKSALKKPTKPTWDEVLARPERLVSDRIEAASVESGYRWTPEIGAAVRRVEDALLTRIEALEKRYGAD